METKTEPLPTIKKVKTKQLSTNEDEVKQIESFLTTKKSNRFFFEIYNEINARGTSNKDTLKFMENLDRLMSLCVNGDATPLQTCQDIEKEIEGYDIDLYHKLLIYEFILMFLKDYYMPSDEGEQNSIAIMIKTLRDKQRELNKTNNFSRFIPMFNFEKVKEQLEKIPDIVDKIKYLIDVKTNFLQFTAGKEKRKINWNWEWEFDKIIDEAFADKCDLEITKLDKILTLEPEALSEKEPQLNGYTNAQLVLIFYYFFKYCGLEPRVKIDIAPIAKFMHLITGKKFTATTNSDFYKKLQIVPNIKTGRGLIKDLEVIKPLFKAAQLNEIVGLIESEISIARK
jgi:hypothetical protein